MASHNFSARPLQPIGDRPCAKRSYPDYTPSDILQGTNPGQEVEITLERGAKRKLKIFDSYTGRDLGEAVPYSLQLMTWLLDLHLNLLAGPTGRLVNGVAAILLTLLSFTGAVIWWPGIRNWRRSLTINPKASWKRINWELHSAIGFWTFVFFFMWSFTGIYLVFPAPFDTLINRFAPLDYYRLVSRQSEPSLLLTKTGSAVVFVPVADTANTKGKRRRRTIHYSNGDQIIRAFFGLHFGNFAGLGTRIVWAAIGLTPTFLFITGALMWWNRVLSREGRRLRSGN
ncbi:MAG: PepSY-associated TM helix domain-containing protein [Bryobacteraceae bacterium]